jgi:hypothetical protein
MTNCNNEINGDYFASQNQQVHLASNECICMHMHFSRKNVKVKDTSMHMHVFHAYAHVQTVLRHVFLAALNTV